MKLVMDDEELGNLGNSRSYRVPSMGFGMALRDALPIQAAPKEIAEVTLAWRDSRNLYMAKLPMIGNDLRSLPDMRVTPGRSLCYHASRELLKSSAILDNSSRQLINRRNNKALLLHLDLLLTHYISLYNFKYW